MYIGHLGLALAAKRLRRDAPMWVLVFATQGCDWIQAVACTRNPDTSAMWSHSLPAAAALAALVALLAFAVTRNGASAALAAGVAVSHVLVDYITGRKPTWPGGPIIGLDL